MKQNIPLKLDFFKIKSIFFNAAKLAPCNKRVVQTASRGNFTGARQNCDIFKAPGG